MSETNKNNQEEIELRDGRFEIDPNIVEGSASFESERGTAAYLNSTFLILSNGETPIRAIAIDPSLVDNGNKITLDLDEAALEGVTNATVGIISNGGRVAEGKFEEGKSYDIVKSETSKYGGYTVLDDDGKEVLGNEGAGLITAYSGFNPNQDQYARFDGEGEIQLEDIYNRDGIEVDTAAGENISDFDYDDIIIRTNGVETVLTELVKPIEIRQQDEKVIAVEETRQFETTDTQKSKTQAPISISSVHTNHNERDENGTPTIRDRATAASVGSNGDVNIRTTWVLNNDKPYTSSTEVAGEPIIDELKFKDGVLEIPQSSSIASNTSAEIKTSSRDGDAMFQNARVLVALDEKGAPLRAIAMNGSGETTTLSEEFLQGAAGVAPAIIPGGKDNPNLSAGKIYNVGESNINEGLALFDGNTEITGTEKSAASLISTNRDINPGKQDLAVIANNVASFEDVANTPTQRAEVWKSDMDLNDAQITLNGKTYTPTTETVVDHSPRATAYAGVTAGGKLDGSSVNVGGVIGVVDSPVKEDGTERRVRFGAEVEGGMAATRITNKTTTITSTFEATKQGTQRVTGDATLQTGTETYHVDRDGKETLVDRQLNEPVVVEKGGQPIGDPTFGEETVKKVDEKRESKSSNSVGVDGYAAGRVFMEVGTPFPEAGAVTGRAQVEGIVNTRGDQSGELNASLEATYHATDDLGISAKARQQVLGDRKGFEALAEVRYGGTGGSAQPLTPIDSGIEKAVSEFHKNNPDNIFTVENTSINDTLSGAQPLNNIQDKSIAAQQR